MPFSDPDPGTQHTGPGPGGSEKRQSWTSIFGSAGTPVTLFSAML